MTSVWLHTSSMQGLKQETSHLRYLLAVHTGTGRDGSAGDVTGAVIRHEAACAVSRSFCIFSRPRESCCM